VTKSQEHKESVNRLTDAIGWINQRLNPTPCSSVDLLYNDMDSQSGRCLPLIYQPFDPTNRSHWADRGSMFDYLISTGGGRLLDFGPGDGWPSLVLAPYVDEVVGVDGSLCRVRECARNAHHMNITNAHFVHAEPNAPIPFPDASFDGITAATSIEQSPNPQATISELHRVLKPGGRMRIAYESLAQYAGSREREIDVMTIGNDKCRLIIYDRQIENERVDHYGLTLSLTKPNLLQFLSFHSASPHCSDHGTL